MSETEVKKQEQGAQGAQGADTRGEQAAEVKQDTPAKAAGKSKGTKGSSPKPTPAPAPAPISKEEAAIAAAKAGPEPETLQQATQTFLDKLSFVCGSRRAPGDVHAIRQELERFLALNHGIMREYCVPVHPEVEQHFKGLRAAQSK
jgi:hypothetical protein